MNNHHKLLTAVAAKNLADRLTKVPSVSQFDLAGEPQGSTIGHALSDIEDSCSVILNSLLPKLLDQAKSADELDEVLLDIGEELRHILYHIKDTRYFGYLCDDDDQESSAASSPKSADHA